MRFLSVMLGFLCLPNRPLISAGRVSVRDVVCVAGAKAYWSLKLGQFDSRAFASTVWASRPTRSAMKIKVIVEKSQNIRAPRKIEKERAAA